MRTTTRVADDSDLPVVDELDRHLSREELAPIVQLGRILIAEVDGVGVGSLRWGLFWDEVPFMNLLFVDPTWRGQGIGTALVEAWEKSQLAAGHTLVLTSTSAAERAQHLYRKLGYVDTGSVFLPDEPTEVILRKDLVT
jgi:GNAT superfamily N-acetyltransferase